MESKTIIGGYPGDNGELIPKFPEQLEKEVGNIIGRNTQRWIGTAIDDPKWQVLDRETLIYELLEYITNEFISKNNKTS